MSVHGKHLFNFNITRFPLYLIDLGGGGGFGAAAANE